MPVHTETIASASGDDAGKQGVGVPEEPVAPERVVQPAGRRRGSSASRPSTTRSRPSRGRRPARRGLCAYGHRNGRHSTPATSRGQQRRRREPHDAVAGEPLARARQRCGDHRDDGHRHQVDGAQRLEREPHREPESLARSRVAQQVVQREERERQELHVHRLHVAHPRQQVRVERGEDAPEDRCRPIVRSTGAARDWSPSPSTPSRR